MCVCVCNLEADKDGDAIPAVRKWRKSTNTDTHTHTGKHEAEQLNRSGRGMMSADRQTEEAGPYLQAARSTLARNFLPLLQEQ